MLDAPPTNPTLLIRLRDTANGEAWRRFAEIYAPVLYLFFRRRGEQDADAADLTQEVLREVVKGIGRLEYDPARGTFRGWLYRTAYRRWIDFRVRSRRLPGSIGEAQADSLAADDNAEALWWERENERHVLSLAARQVQGEVEEKTWEAFSRTAVQGEAAANVAQTLGMSLGAVYVAKSRVISRIRTIVSQMNEDLT